MKTFKITTVIITMVTLIIACSESNDVDPTIACGGSMLTGQVNGNNFAASDELVTAKLSPSGLTNIFVITGACATSISGAASSESIGLVVALENLDDFSEGNSWKSMEESTNTVIGQYIIVQASLADADGVIASSDNMEGDAFFRITALNTTTQTISGEFNFTGIDENNGELYTITNGRINQVPYTVE
jgi:hypothetical protein